MCVLKSNKAEYFFLRQSQKKPSLRLGGRALINSRVAQRKSPPKAGAHPKKIVFSISIEYIYITRLLFSYSLLTLIMDQTLGFSPPGGPTHEVALFRQRLYGPPGYAGPVNEGPSYDPVDYLETFYARRPHQHDAPGSAPNNLIYRESPAVDSIHNGRIPLSQQPGFELQHNFMMSSNPLPMHMLPPLPGHPNASPITEVD